MKKFTLLLITTLFLNSCNHNDVKNIKNILAEDKTNQPNEDIVHKTTAIMIDKFHYNEISSIEKKDGLKLYASVGYNSIIHAATSNHHTRSSYHKYVSVFRFKNGILFEQYDRETYYNFEIGDTVNVDFRDRVFGNKITGFIINKIYK